MVSSTINDSITQMNDNFTKMGDSIAKIDDCSTKNDTVNKIKMTHIVKGSLATSACVVSEVA